MLESLHVLDPLYLLDVVAAEVQYFKPEGGNSFHRSKGAVADADPLDVLGDAGNGGNVGFGAVNFSEDVLSHLNIISLTIVKPN